ncbi:MAG: DUF3137 domain-containing protein [Halomonas sp.]|uniref:DUF3137 domain-containing protein n=1 Tax=Halomonas sp. TaxID=1486246 RepID=UPI003F9233AF
MRVDTAVAGRAENLPEGFVEYYTGTIEPQLERFDEKRRLGVKLMIAGGVVVVLDLVALFWLNSQGVTSSMVLVAGLAVAALAGLGVFLTYRKTRQLVKTALVEPGCRFLGYDYVQKPRDFPVEQFYDLRLIRRRQQTSTQVEDGISGTYNGIGFRLCEVEIRDRSNQDKEQKSSSDKNKNLLFRGVLFISEFPRNFTGETRVLHSAHLSLLPKSALDGSRLESVHLEESKFSQSYHVYSNDQVEARYLLNPRFMELLMELVARFNPSPELPPDQAEAIEQSWIYQKMMDVANSLSVAFVDNQMLIAVGTRENRFEGGSLLKSLKDRQRVEQLLEELQVVPQILDTLSLEGK